LLYLMSVDFQLDGTYEHKVQSDVVFNLRVNKDGQPADVDYPVEAWLKGISDNVRGEVKYTKGNYRLGFFPGTTGKFELHIKVNKQWLYKDGDVTVSIVDRVSQHYVDIVFEVRGPGLEGGLVGKTTHIEFTTKDGHGDMVNPDDIHELEVRVGTVPNVQKIRPTHLDKGVFKATFEVDTPGFYNVDVWYQDKSVLKEPSRAHFTNPASARNTRATNVPKGFVTVGKETTFTIQARTKNDLNATSGGDVFDLSCDGPGKLSDLTVRDTLDGKYIVSFTPPESGVFEFKILLNGEEIGNSPVKISATRK